MWFSGWKRSTDSSYPLFHAQKRTMSTDAPPPGRPVLTPTRSCGRLRRDVVDHAVDSAHFIHNPAEMRFSTHTAAASSPRSCRPPNAPHAPPPCTHRSLVAITPTLITGSSTAKLCQIFEYSPALDLRHHDLVRLLQQRHTLPSDLAQNAYRQPRPWKRLPAQNVFRISRSRPMRRTSSLNRSPERLNQLELHANGNPPTLWWLLMVWLGPFTLDDSITSG